jgi:hypothetical protein
MTTEDLLSILVKVVRATSHTPLPCHISGIACRFRLRFGNHGNIESNPAGIKKIRPEISIEIRMQAEGLLQHKSGLIRNVPFPLQAKMHMVLQPSQATAISTNSIPIIITCNGLTGLKPTLNPPCPGRIHPC